MTLVKAEENLETKNPLPKGWRWIRLGEACEFAYGSSLPEIGRNKGTIPVYGSNGVVGYHDEPVTQGPTLIIGRKGSIGEVNYSSGPCWPIDTTYYVDSSKTSCDLSWLFFLLKFIKLNALNKASGVPGLNRNDAYDQLIPLPPTLAEQERIARILNEQMAAVEKARAAAEARLEAAEALTAAYLRQVFPQLGQALPLGWCWTRLGDTFDVKQGVAMSPLRRQGVAPYPFLRTLNVLWGFVDLSYLDKMDFTDDEVTSLNLRNGDLLVCEGGDVGRTAIWRGEMDVCLYQNHVHRLRRRSDSIIPDFYLYWMRAAFKVFQSYKGKEVTTTIPNLSGGQLKSFLVPLPPTNEQKRIASLLSEKIAAVEKTVQTLQQELETINTLPAALLRRAFTGGL